MKANHLTIIRLLPCLALLLCLAPQAAAEEARDLCSDVKIEGHYGFSCWESLTDGDTTTPNALPQEAWVTFTCPEAIGSLYLIFDLEPGPYCLRNEDTGEVHTAGEQGFLHAFLDLTAIFDAAPRSVTLSFPSKSVNLNEVSLFSPGSVPDQVQRWQPPKEGKTDLLLLSAHGDDEQLFFAGLLPLYAGEREYEVSVAYLTDHRNVTNLRCHEMLDGLWAAGVTTYPIFGPFGDFYCKDKDYAYDLHQRNGESREMLMSFVVEQLRRFRPQVAVTHDPKGEYGHGQHKVCAELLTLALDAAEDPHTFPDSAAQWGTWSVPKTYLHLWPENSITLDLDQPLPRFGGMTPFQVTQKLGFPCHKSQQWGFSWFLRGYQRASDIPSYNPCRYGLYRSTVGPDTGAGDLFEHLTSYARQDRQAAALRAGEQVRKLRAATRSAAWQRQRQAAKAEEVRLRLLEEDARRRAEQAHMQRTAVSFGAILAAGAGIFCLRKKLGKNFFVF